MIILLAVALFFFHSDLNLSPDAFFPETIGLTRQCCNDETNNWIKNKGNEEK